MKTVKNIIKLVEKQNPILRFVLYAAIAYGLYHLFLFIQWKVAEQGLFVQEPFTGSGKEFVLFHWKDCGHCKNMMPEWNKFQSSFKGKAIKVSKVEKDENPKAMEKLGIQGFPTIMLLNNGKKVKDYSGERTANAFANFANQA
jgi:thiol-disulfide isomerase/thioredoxin